MSESPAGETPGVVWGKYLVHRTKVVRPDFIQGITEHWAGRMQEKNTIDYAAAYADVGAE